VARFAFALAIAALVAILPAEAPADDHELEVGGRMFAREITLEHDGTSYDMVATGSHKRKKFFFSVYAAVAYAEASVFDGPVDEDTDAGAIALESSKPLRMHLKMLRGLDSSKITNGINEALEKTAVRPIEEIADERERFVELFDGELDEDQSLVMTWWPGEGLEIAMDDEVLDTIAGDAFARAFFEIYFGPEPVDDGMKEDLLDAVVE